MKDQAFGKDELLELIGEVLEGEPSAASREKLQRILLESREARELYRQHMELHARLSFDYTGGLGLEAMPGDPRRARRAGLTRVTISTMAIAAALLATLFVVAILEFRSGRPLPSVTLAPSGVAVLSRTLNVAWDTDGEAHQEGDALEAGRVKMVSGLMEIEFLSGASVIVEGPADLELIDEKRAICRKGRLRVFVPEPAKGFTISAPSFDVVDLGTEFAMSVNEAGGNEVHVLDGSVDLHGKDGSLLKSLHAGDAARQGKASEKLEAMPASGEQFVDSRRLSELKGQHSGSRFEEWRRYRARWVEDPAAILYFDFENQSSWERQLRSARPDQPTGGIVGAQWVSGRWPEKSALEFKRTSDRVRIDVPGQWEAISFAAWIRIEGLDRRHNALFLADEWNQGEPHWQIGEAGQLSLAVNSVGRERTESLLGPSDLGSWLHVVVTCDPVARTISHYLNGRLVSSGETNHTGPILIGGAEIGNWRPHEKVNAPAELRSFNGRIDELLILGRVMSVAEISEHYEIGDPYR